ncbi:ABC transporter ATP-binding protein [Pseudomonas typographi]|uniref:ABC transporter ATP-binding protein n=1 Tax=Pseudomonas typographi TaxID=2715964 RepID=A0ABR7Z240_9PSED|nr:ABC transporter ATP-binding protein [Pseudomonas typographi]MBD1587444.1 ABC transporter ATP-binding protein [Pseudomonas typographi]MBD1599474.1 ABC transporter ATP-binding protein [Pseudomonas typographi]
MSALLEVRNLSVRYATARGELNAVSAVDLDLAVGQTLGLVGESGCGKSSLGKALVRLVNPSEGEIRVNGTDLATLSGKRLKASRHDVQMVFQDPSSALDPRLSIFDSIDEPLRARGELSKPQRQQRVAELMRQVGLHEDLASRLPHQLSGGQRQRVVIARALAPRPAMIICDEPVSALDVSLQAQILNLLCDLQEQLGIAYLFISHDLSVVQYLADRIAVMYLGQIVEIGDRSPFWQRPAHPYSQALIAAVPVMDPTLSRAADKQVIGGDVPSPYTPPSGCRFHTRCPQVHDRCKEEQPRLQALQTGHHVACHLYDATTGAPA